MNPEKQFPVLGHQYIPGAPESVPWRLFDEPRIAAQIAQFHGQTLERLAERGGLSIGEIAGHLNGRTWVEVTRMGMRENGAQALRIVKDAVAALEART